MVLKTTQRYAHLDRAYMANRATEIDDAPWAAHRDRTSAQAR